MTNDQIIRAWKDDGYRSSLSSAEKAMLPANPAGMVEITDTDLDSPAGGTLVSIVASAISITLTLVTIQFSCHPGCKPSN